MNGPLLSYDEINNLSSLLSKKLESFLYRYSLDNQLSAVNLDGAIININIYPEDNDVSELSDLLSDNDYASDEFDKMINDVLEETVLSDTVKKISQYIQYKGDKVENNIIILILRKNILELESLDDATIYDYEPSTGVDMVYDMSPYGEVVMKIGQGSYGVVKLYENMSDGKKYAVKFMKLFYDKQLEQSSLHEISILRRCNHEYIIPLLGIVSEKDTFDKVGIIMPRMKSDLSKHLIENENMPLAKLKKYVYQIVTATAYLHSRDIIHRDLKPQNILYDEIQDTVLLTDFGISKALACPPNTDKTLEIITLWYRPPEILLGGTDYSYHVDIWSLGTIVYEILVGRPLFVGSSEIDQLYRIFRVLATPTDDVWPGVSNFPEWKRSFPSWKKSDKIRKDIEKVTGSETDAWVKLIEDALVYQPSKRSTAFEMMDNKLFDDVRIKSVQPQHFSCLDNLYLRRRSSKKNRFDEATNLNSRMRNVLLDWLIDVNRLYKLKPGTFCFMQYLIDEYLPLDITRSDLQGFGLSCLNIAASYLQVWPPETNDYVYISDNSYKLEWLNNKVKEILEGMKYDLVVTTVSDFVKEYCESFYTPDVSNTAIALLYTSVLLKNPFVFEEYECALWAIYYACKYHNITYKHEYLLPVKDILKYPLQKPRPSKSAENILKRDTGDTFDKFMEKVNE